MTDVKQVTEAIDNLGSDWKEFKGHIEDRLSKVETDLDTPLLGRSNGSRDLRDAAQALTLYAREGNPELLRKAVTIGSTTAGGFAVPEVIDRDIETEMKTGTPWLDLAKVVAADSAEYRHLVSDRGLSSGWVGESGNRSETGTMGFREIVPTHGELYSNPKLSNWAVSDVFFDLAGFVREHVAEEFAYQLDSKVVNGDGSNTLTGLLNSSPESASDDGSPARTAGVFQYVPTGISDGFGSLSTTSPEHYPADVLIDTVKTLRSPYRARASWVMNSNTWAAVQKFRDADGRSLVGMNLSTAAPEMLLGYPVFISESMPDVGANAHPIGFGDWKRAYLLVRYHQLMLIRDDVTSKGFTFLYFSRRYGGKPLNDQAAKFVKCAVS